MLTTAVECNGQKNAALASRPSDAYDSGNQQKLSVRGGPALIQAGDIKVSQSLSHNAKSPYESMTLTCHWSFAHVGPRVASAGQNTPQTARLLHQALALNEL